jgi:Kef-type K+ transport system membrane component KefB
MSVGVFLLALIAIFVAAKLFGELAERIGQPAVLGELLGGVLVGVSGLRLVNPSADVIHLLAQLGIVLLLFLIGLETELARLVACGWSAVVVAVAGVALTFAGGYAIGTALHFPPLVAVFLGGALTATSVGITARVLSDLGHLRDAEAQVILGAAVVDDIIGVVLLTCIGSVAAGNGVGPLAVARIAAIAFGFVAGALVIGSVLAPLLIRAIDRIGMARGLFFTSIVFALTLAWVADRAGTAIIIGSFAAGLVLARTEKGSEIKQQVNEVVQFFVPIFFVAVGAAIDVKTLNPLDPAARRFLVVGVLLAVVAVAGKIAAGFLVPGRGLRRSVIGVGMIPRGEVSLIFAQIGLASGLLSAGLYGSIAIMVVITAFITPLLLRRMLPPTGLAEEYDGAKAVVEVPMEDERRHQPRAGGHGPRRDLPEAAARSSREAASDE